MKKLILFFVLSMSTVCVSFSQCNTYFNFKEGTNFEVVNYSAKDKKQSTTTYSVVSYDETASGFKGNLKVTISDHKDKLINESQVDMSCSSGIYHMDMTGFIPAESLKSLGSIETRLETKNLAIPNELSIGKKLEDGYISMVAEGGLPLSIRVDIVNRKVVAKEKITTPAGTFTCFKITYDTKMKTIFSVSYKGVDYIARGVGMVKNETYKSNGKLVSYSLLDSFNK